MTFFGQIVRLTIDLLPGAIVYRLPFLLPIVALLIARRRAVERRILGRCQSSFWHELAMTTVLGIMAGLVGTLAMLYLGITIDTQGFYYILLVAVLLMLLDLRYLCLAYASGLLSLFSLATGLPKLHIPGLLALVAILHFTESALILVGGDQQALPVYLHRPGGTVGGYLLQQVWPIPLIVLTMTVVENSESLALLHLPNWWPLIPLQLVKAMNIAFLMVPAAAALGYGDLALTSSPRVKATRTAGLLGLYSIVLLALAIVSGRMPAITWIAALFAPVGHELVLYLARYMELHGTPAFAQVANGVKILAVLSGSRAAVAGLRPGQVITTVNGEQVQSRRDLLARLNEGKTSTITIAPYRGQAESMRRFPGNAGLLGLVFAPDLDDPAQVNVKPWRFMPGRRENA